MIAALPTTHKQQYSPRPTSSSAPAAHLMRPGGPVRRGLDLDDGDRRGRTDGGRISAGQRAAAILYLATAVLVLRLGGRAASVCAPVEHGRPGHGNRRARAPPHRPAMIGTAPAAAGALSNAPRIARTRLEENAEKPVVGDRL